MQFFKDGIGGGCPLEWLAVGVVRGDEVVDALHELFDAGEGPASNGLVGDQGEESLDLVQPRTVGRDEVHVPARSGGQPSLDLRVAMCGVVVADAMNVQLGWHGLVDLAQEGQEFLMPMARLARSQHSRTIMPRAYMATILSSNPVKRRSCLAMSSGSKLPSRSRGTSMRSGPSSVKTVLPVLPLRWLSASAGLSPPGA